MTDLADLKLDPKTTRETLEKIACDLDDLIVVADTAGRAKLSAILTRAADTIDRAIDAIAATS